jgi:5'-3' exonuclease
MGIPSYFSYIVKNHPEIIKKFIDNKFFVNNFYLDCNSIIYDTYNKILIENGKSNNLANDWLVLHIYKCVVSKIEEYLAIIQPTDNIIVAFDGVAPVAKLEQQRQRRYKSWYQNEVTNMIYKRVSNKDAWTTASITPGTKFMADLNVYVTKHFEKYEKCKNVYISGSDNYGEGEHKIFDFIRKYPDQHINKQNTVIYGLDADLIMLSINHLPVCPQIYLFRETPHFIQSIDSSLEPEAYYFLDIPELTNNLLCFMSNDEAKNDSTPNYNKVYDYILLCFFLGNDFMPHFPALNIRTGGVDKMLNAYKATVKVDEYLCDGNKINWAILRKVVQHLANLEEEYIKTEHKNRDKKEKYDMPESTPEEKFKKFEATPLHNRKLEKIINPFKPWWQSRYYHFIFDIHTDKNGEFVRDICINYCQGLEWTMKYYTSGCPDWRWKYKYTYPPLLQDLIKFIPAFDTTFFSNNTRNIKPVSELVQLCYVLPRNSLTLLPTRFYNELIKYYDDCYRTDCKFLWAYCRYFWESHVEMSEIELDELESFIYNNRHLLM